jgi:hypothetical protein
MMLDPIRYKWRPESHMETEHEYAGLDARQVYAVLGDLGTGVNKDGRRLILMPWFVYSNVTPEDADAVAYYLKNVLPAVKNEIPAPSLNPGFEEFVPVEEFQGSQTGPLSPVIIVVVGVAVILLVSIGVAVLRRRSS